MFPGGHGDRFGDPAHAGGEPDAIFHYSMQLSMIVFAPHIGAELDWLQLTQIF
eukprot:COSAG05_NODE_445_length_9773_cov_4.588071_8_plen_53_part_00